MTCPSAWMPEGLKRRADDDDLRLARFAQPGVRQALRIIRLQEGDEALPHQTA